MATLTPRSAYAATFIPTTADYQLDQDSSYSYHAQSSSYCPSPQLNSRPPSPTFSQDATPDSSRPSTPLHPGKLLRRGSSANTLRISFASSGERPPILSGNIVGRGGETPGEDRQRWLTPKSPKQVKEASVTFAKAVAKPATYLHLIKRFTKFVISLDISLSAFFVFSVTQTISNKYLLRGWYPFPWILTTTQLLFCYVGTLVAAKAGMYTPARVSPDRAMRLRFISILFSAELLCANVGLRMVSVPFHISVRALSPLLTLLVSIIAFDTVTTLRTASTLLLILLGISFTSHSEPSWTSLGSVLTCSSVLLATLKSIVTNRLLLSSEGYDLHPLEVLSRMSQWGMLHCAVFAVFNGELDEFWRFLRGDEVGWAATGVVGLNGLVSFLVVLVGLQAEKRTRAPAKDVSSYAAQAFTIVTAAFVFGLKLSPMNFLGVALTLSGSVAYSHLEALDVPPLPVGKILPD